jgi:hypothetical protein
VIARNVEGIAAIQLPGKERACLPAGLVEYGKAVIVSCALRRAFP